MRDIIDERDKKESISRSIVKFWNVNYIAAPYEKEQGVPPVAEADADGENHGGEAWSREAYNAATGSYSGAYGMEKDVDEVEQERIDRILQEKEEALKSLIDEHSEDEEQ